MDKLAEIMAHKRKEIAHLVRPVRDRELERFAGIQRPGLSFRTALDLPDRLSVIAEIKRKSPSAGDIAPGIDAVEQARRYYNAGADCLSVLTDSRYFGGSLPDLWNVTDFMSLRADARPCLRKDFMVHPVQVVEAAEAGARAILIIVRALDDDEMRALFDAATLAGLDALFEVHEEPEIERALRIGARIVGVNNRDLARFTTDIGISERLIPLIPDDITAVSESGIHCPGDASRARACGADAVLVGQCLMETPEEDLDAMMEAFHNA